MKQIRIEDEHIKDFLRGLPLGTEGVALEVDGSVLCKVIDPHQLSDADRDAILQTGWERVRRARDRNKGVPAKIIDREVSEAVEEVRGRDQLK